MSDTHQSQSKTLDSNTPSPPHAALPLRSLFTFLSFTSLSLLCFVSSLHLPSIFYLHPHSADGPPQPSSTFPECTAFTALLSSTIASNLAQSSAVTILAVPNTYLTHHISPTSLADILRCSISSPPRPPDLPPDLEKILDAPKAEMDWCSGPLNERHVVNRGPLSVSFQTAQAIRLRELRYLFSPLLSDFASSRGGGLLHQSTKLQSPSLFSSLPPIPNSTPEASNGVLSLSDSSSFPSSSRTTPPTSSSLSASRFNTTHLLLKSASARSAAHERATGIEDKTGLSPCYYFDNDTIASVPTVYRDRSHVLAYRLGRQVRSGP